MQTLNSGDLVWDKLTECNVRVLSVITRHNGKVLYRVDAPSDGGMRAGSDLGPAREETSNA